MSIKELKRVQFLTENHSNLQGLRALPIWNVGGAFGLALLLSTSKSHLAGFAFAMLWFIGSLLAAPILYWFIGDYYRKRYGSVELRPSRRDVLYSVLFTIAIMLDGQTGGAVSIFALCAAVYCLENWRQAPDLRGYYAILAVLLAVTGVAIGVVPSMNRIAVLIIATSLINVIGSLLDHRLLSTLMRPPRDNVYA